MGKNGEARRKNGRKSNADGNKRAAARVGGRALAALGTAPTESAMANLANW